MNTVKHTLEWEIRKDQPILGLSLRKPQTPPQSTPYEVPKVLLRPTDSTRTQTTLLYSLRSSMVASMVECAHI